METIKTHDFYGQFVRQESNKYWRTNEYVNEAIRRSGIGEIECRGIGSYGGGQRLVALVDAVFQMGMKVIREKHGGNH